MILPSGYSTTNYSVSAAAKGWGAGWPNCQAPSATITLKITGQRLIVHPRTATLWLTLLNQMEAGGYRCHTPEVWCWGGECRNISGTNTPSNHSWNNAVDVNAPNNPYTSSGQHDIPDWVYAMFRRFGFGLGADYSGKKDWMHIEFMGTPGDADIMTAAAVKEFGGGTKPPTQDELDEASIMAAKDDILNAIAALNKRLDGLPITIWTLPITSDKPEGRANALLAAAVASSGGAAQAAQVAATIAQKNRQTILGPPTGPDRLGELWNQGEEILAAVGGDPTPPQETYTVVSGDTMGSIASKLGVTLDALKAANPKITNPDLIAVGDVLNVPKA